VAVVAASIGNTLAPDGSALGAVYPVSVSRGRAGAAASAVPCLAVCSDPAEAPSEKWRRRHSSLSRAGARIVSTCVGAFTPAAAGLLDGRPATTHWRWADALRSRHPQVEVDPNPLYVDDGDVLTGAGSAATLDLLLHAA
jgi:transcriptional regulator GlxA family with amidase domain